MAEPQPIHHHVLYLASARLKRPLFFFLLFLRVSDYTTCIVLTFVTVVGAQINPLFSSFGILDIFPTPLYFSQSQTIVDACKVLVGQEHLTERARAARRRRQVYQHHCDITTES